MDLYGYSAYEVQRAIDAALKRAHEAATNLQAPVPEAYARLEGLSGPTGTGSHAHRRRLPSEVS